jgi:lactoylglutathione lyase
MKLRKSTVDLGLRTSKGAQVLSFWQEEVGLPFLGVAKHTPGQEQHRHDANGSLLKINVHEAPLEPHPAPGYREIILARDDVAAPRRLVDPEGVGVVLAPRGHEGVSQLGVRIGVRDLAAHRRFYLEALRLPEARPGVFAANDTLIFLEADRNAPDDAEMYGPGFRYVTFHVEDNAAEHAHALGQGAREAWAPLIVNSAATTAVSMIRDLDGNWIEILQPP